MRKEEKRHGNRDNREKRNRKKRIENKEKG